jgi:hypothetical protein
MGKEEVSENRTIREIAEERTGTTAADNGKGQRKNATAGDDS